MVMVNQPHHQTKKIVGLRKSKRVKDLNLNRPTCHYYPNNDTQYLSYEKYSHKISKKAFPFNKILIVFEIFARKIDTIFLKLPNRFVYPSVI